MAHTGVTSQGFELARRTCEHEVMYIPGDPGDSFVRGDQVVCTVGEGLADLAAANEGGIIGRVVHDVTCPAATTAAPKPADFDPASGAAANACLIPIEVNVPAGLPIYAVTFSGHDDEAIVTYTAATPSINVTTGMATDDYPNGAIVYVYEGPGAGEVGVVADYDHADHADGALAVILHRKFDATLTTSSSVIILAGEGAASTGHGFFNRIESAGDNAVITTQGANDGDWVIFMDYRQSAYYLNRLQLPVIPARYLLLA